MDSLAGLIFIALCILFVWWSYQQGRAGAASFEASRSPSDVVMSALQTFSQRGWTTTAQTGQTISFTKSQAPGCLITFFLLLFGIIPGLLYWIAAKRTLAVSVTAQPGGQAGGSLVNVAWSRNGGGRGPSLEFKNLLAPGAPLSVAEVRPPSTITSGVEDLTGGAVSAAELRRQPTGRVLPVQGEQVSAQPADREAANVSVNPPATAPSPAFCPYCGTRVMVAGQSFCATCGRALGGEGMGNHAPMS
jgi:hypothetical protein